MNTLVCSRCSKRLPAGADFCRRCGTRVASVPREPLRSEPVRSTSMTTAAPHPPSRGALAALAPVAVIVVAAGVVLMWALLRTAHSVSTARYAVTPPSLPAVPSPSFQQMTPALPPLPPLPAWSRHLPPDLAGMHLPGNRLDQRGQILTQGRFIGDDLRNAVFAGAELGQASFERADLTGADFRGASLSQANLAGADLTKARFDEAQIHQTSFVGADTGAVSGKTRVRNGIIEPVPPPPLPAKNAGKATFRGARFSQVSLEELDLAGADLRGAEFSQCRLGNANLAGANLRETRHLGTDFSGAKLSGADLRGADLSSARNLTEAQLAAAVTDETTRMPRR